jgi:putative membrane protein
MTVRWLLATIHLLGLAVGLGAIWARGRAFRGPLDPAGLRRLFHADNWWGVSALLSIGTGLLRAFAGFEKGTDYYLHNHLFWGKMTLLVAILVLEVRPMMALIRWRSAVGRGGVPDTRHAAAFARTSFLQGAMLLLMLFAATAIARGFGLPAG